MIRLWSEYDQNSLKWIELLYSYFPWPVPLRYILMLIESVCITYDIYWDPILEEEEKIYILLSLYLCQDKDNSIMSIATTRVNWDRGRLIHLRISAYQYIFANLCFNLNFLNPKSWNWHWCMVVQCIYPNILVLAKKSNFISSPLNFLRSLIETGMGVG